MHWPGGLEAQAPAGICKHWPIVMQIRTLTASFADSASPLQTTRQHESERFEGLHSSTFLGAFSGGMASRRSWGWQSGQAGGDGQDAYQGFPWFPLIRGLRWKVAGFWSSYKDDGMFEGGVACRAYPLCLLNSLDLNGARS